MRLVIYEIKKFFSQRFVGILIILIFLINAALCCYEAIKDIKDDNKIPDKYWQKILEIYKDDSQAVEETHKYLYDDLMTQVNAAVYAIDNNQQHLPLVLQYDYIDYGKFSDVDLFRAFITYRDNVEDYQGNVQSYINQAIRQKQDMEDFQNDMNSFSYDYQSKIISVYTELLEKTEVGFDYIYGWTILFPYEGAGFLGIIAALVIGCIIFSYDKNCGMSAIILPSKKGKYSTVSAKIIAAVLLAAGISLALSLSSFIIIGILRGYSNPFNAIQIYTDYLLCPFDMTFIGGYIISALMKALACSAFILIVLFVSVLLNKYIFTFFAGGLIIGINYAVNIINTSSQYKYLNIISLSSMYDMLSRYRAVPLFNQAIGFFAVLLFSYAAMCIIFIAGILYVSQSREVKNYSFEIFSNQMAKIDTFNKTKVFFKNVKTKMHIAINNINKSEKTKKYPQSFIWWEISKQRMFILIIAILAVAKIYFVSEEYSSKNFSAADLVYKEYMNYLSGSVTEGKLEYIKNEFEYIQSVCDIENEMSKKYRTGEITSEEYKNYLEEYTYAQTRKDVIVQIKGQAEYLNGIKQKYDIDGHFIYETDILKVIERQFDIFLYVAVILFSGGLYICEYKGNSSSNWFALILRSTKNGKNKVFRTKLNTAILSALCFYIIFSIIDITAILFKYKMPNLNVPLMSIRSYENIESSISIIEYLALILFVSLIAVTILSVMAVSISQLLKKTISIYSIIVLFTLVPYVLGNLNLTVCKYIDFTQLMASDGLIKFSLDVNMFGKYGYMAVFLTIICGICTSLCILSQRKYCIK